MEHRKVLIADDTGRARLGLLTLLAPRPEIDIAGEVDRMVGVVLGETVEAKKVP